MKEKTDRSRQSIVIEKFICSIKNAGVIITNEQCVIKEMEKSDNPARAFLALAIQGRQMGVSFYKRGMGTDLAAIAQAFHTLEGEGLGSHYFGFLNNLRPDPAPEIPLATDGFS